MMGRVSWGQLAAWPCYGGSFPSNLWMLSKSHHPGSQTVCGLMQTRVSSRNRRRPRQCKGWSKTFLSKSMGPTVNRWRHRWRCVSGQWSKTFCVLGHCATRARNLLLRCQGKVWVFELEAIRARKGVACDETEESRLDLTRDVMYVLSAFDPDAC